MQLNAATSQFKVLAHASISEGCVRGEDQGTNVFNLDFPAEC